MSDQGEPRQSELDARLAFTVATVWRSERISCPHPHVLQSWLQGGLEGGAAEFVAFHLEDSECPYCNATVDDLKARDDEATEADGCKRGTLSLMVGFRVRLGLG